MFFRFKKERVVPYFLSIGFPLARELFNICVYVKPRQMIPVIEQAYRMMDIQSMSVTPKRYLFLFSQRV